MKANDMLNEIKTLLNIEVKLEEQKLENGTVVSAEAFEKGKEIFIVTDDEKVAMPVGEYILEDGRLVVVEVEGVIADVREVSDEVPAKEEETTEDLKEEKEEEEKMADVADWEGMEKRIQNLEDAIASLKDDKVEAEEVGEGGEEAVAGVLDAIPGADVVGLLVGGGIALGAMLKKPREHNPVDNVNASFQLGI